MIATPRKDNPNIMSIVAMSAIDDEAIGFAANVNLDPSNGMLIIVPFDDEFVPIDIDGRRMRASTFCAGLMLYWQAIIAYSLYAGAVTGGVAFGVTMGSMLVSFAICAMVVDTAEPHDINH